MAERYQTVDLLGADVFAYGRVHPLDAFFRPRAVAVIGATERPGSVGRTLFWNLLSNPFGGTVYPVNPRRANVLGVKAFPSVSDLPERPDLAVIAIPAPAVPGVVRECAENGVRAAIIISAGFREVGPEGRELERQILETARAARMRIIGPNCLGVMYPPRGLNATFAHTMALPGSVGFISQSGALCTAILDWSLRENVGFSAFVSVGSMLDVGWGDLIDYLGDDPQTKAILIYMESVGDARSFMSAAREVALTKPIIVIKAGRTEAAARAAASHTGTLAGSDAVLDAAFRRCGVLRVDAIAELFYMAEALGKQPRPRGKRLTIVTNAGGPAVLATDALVAGGGELAPLSPETKAALNSFLPPHWSHGNPVDVLGDADPERYGRAVEVVLRDPTTDALLVILTPQAMTHPTHTAERIRSLIVGHNKPVLASWMGGHAVAAGERLLNQAKIPTYRYPDMAVKVFNYMWRYSDNLRALYETPQLVEDDLDRLLSARDEVNKIVQEILDEGRTIATEFEAKRILELYEIPTVPTRVATSPDEAVAAAEELGYPCVVKLHSKTITHKTDVGGVLLNLKSPDEVREAYETIRQRVTEKAGAEAFDGVTVQPMVTLDGYELIVGSSTDDQFGPVLLFGSGGQLVEVYKDSALGLPPLTTTLARRMMERTRIYEALKGVRGRPPINLNELERILVLFSYLVIHHPRIKEIDINPLLASPDRLVALDARIILHEPSVEDSALPRPAIRPYPVQYIRRITLRDGTPVQIRPIRPEDEPLIVEFHYMLSEETVYLRYFQALKLDQRIAHDRLVRICFVDYDRQIALVAVHKAPDSNKPQIIAVGRLTKIVGTDEAEFALIVADKFQRKGLGTTLLQLLLEVARDEGVKVVSADVLSRNTGMRRICEKLGFHIENTDDPDVLHVWISLDDAPSQ